MSLCSMCPNNCGVDRSLKLGVCGVNDKLRIAKYSIHNFEEPLISGTQGSGTIFFCGCSLKCVFCQNYEVSRNTVGKDISVETLVDIFKKQVDSGVHNINLVNPTHYTHQIMDALNKYRPEIPIVWNTHGYESIKTLEEINDYVDVYLTDLKYYSSTVSARYSLKADYFEKASVATQFMLNNKITDLSGGLMKKGVIVRHLILPLNTNDSIELLRWLRPQMKNGAYLSLMAQYTPYGNIESHPELKRKITKREYEKVLDEVLNLQFENVFIQERDASNVQYIPTWDY